ncbi:sulfurtransferase [Corticicoccus populi]|uniref:Sulfurtransferase n=1 Tax=Corticicoccus populi TaxID=1812821 RepID=A0ABW5WR78_9STAP
MILNKETLHTFDLKRFIVLDCRNVMDNKEKTLELIKEQPLETAVHIPESPFMFTENGINNGRHPLPYKEQVTSLHLALTSGGHELLLVSDAGSFYHTRLYYLFNLYGLKSYLYNGDFQDIKDTKESFARFNGSPKEVEGHTAEFKSDIFRSMSDVAAAVDNKENVLLIDVRTRERYLGITEPIDFKKGHIPGAVNIPNTDIYTDGILNLHALDHMLGQIKEYDEVFVYCGSGMSATPLFTLLYENGVNVKLYAGSFSEWITDASNTVETKENTL